jgi:hypothetical protein
MEASSVSSDAADGGGKASAGPGSGSVRATKRRVPAAHGPGWPIKREPNAPLVVVPGRDSFYRWFTA